MNTLVSHLHFLTSNNGKKKRNVIYDRCNTIVRADYASSGICAKGYRWRTLGQITQFSSTMCMTMCMMKMTKKTSEASLRFSPSKCEFVDRITSRSYLLKKMAFLPITILLLVAGCSGHGVMQVPTTWFDGGGKIGTKTQDQCNPL